MNTDLRAVIDIGSNAIRLVVYGGPLRAPLPIYNEKARVSLGESVDLTGKIDAKTMSAAIAALVRFNALTQSMQVTQRIVVATEATRRASNREDFLAKALAAGVQIELISGEEEALASALGVVCDLPWATGYVADQGGGSLEIARIVDGEARQPVSMPFGTIPLSKRAAFSSKALAQEIGNHLAINKGDEIHKGLPLHLVGGAWRTLAQLHMFVSNYPLNILSNYSLPIEALSDLVTLTQNRQFLEESGVVAAARIAFLPFAASTLEALVKLLKPSAVVVSVFGLREGLLFGASSNDIRNEDPLVAAARHEGERLSRVAFHGEKIAKWVAPLFEDDAPEVERLRHTICLLAGSSWNSHPEYRADHAAKLALEGHWPGVTASDRAIMATGLYAAFGGRRETPAFLEMLAPKELLDRANQWGLAVRLAQRLDGGTGVALDTVTLQSKNGEPSLEYGEGSKQLDVSTVRRRLKHLREAISKSQLNAAVPA